VLRLLKSSVSDVDIYRAANEVIKTYPDPVMHAAARYDELLGKDDIVGCMVWKRILAAIKELLTRELDGAVH
jgi:hypothetical protein